MLSPFCLMKKPRKCLRRNKWITLLELEEGNEKKYILTRRTPKLMLAETRTVKSKKKAKELIDEWLK